MSMKEGFRGNVSLSAKENLSYFCMEGYKKSKVILIGDFMLDHYVYGHVERISPEAPVPVVMLREEKYMPGGAGNVAANLAGLGTTVFALGRSGDDIYGNILRELLLSRGVNISYFDSHGATTLKTRIIGDRGQQMIRLDKDVISKPSGREIIKIINNIKKIIENETIGCVLISDYAKGFCSDELCFNIISFCKKEGLPVFVDPKKNDWSGYSGAFLVTPNLKELSQATGGHVENEDDAVEESAANVVKKYNIDNILVTRSEKGASLVNKDRSDHERSSAVEVFDVSGAGDTMIATMAALFAGGVALRDCVRIANIASQIVVGRVGTYAIEREDLITHVAPDTSSRSIDKPLLIGRKPGGKSVDIAGAVRICSELKRDNKTIVFTNGCFDILHVGHVGLLNEARKLGDFLVVGLNSDSSVRRLKGGGRPINTEYERSRVLEALESVDLVVVFEHDTPEKLIGAIMPDILVKGGDYRKEEVIGGNMVKEVVIIPFLDDVSTSKTIKKIREKNDE